MIIFSEAQDVIFSHMKFQIAIKNSHVTFLQFVWIKPHSSSLTNLENSTSSFSQSVQIFCREEQKEENNGDCKAFCVTRKRSNQLLFFNETITDTKNFIPNENMIYDDRDPPGMNRRIKTIILAKDRGYKVLARKSNDINLRNSFNNLQKKLKPFKMQSKNT